MIVGIAGAKGSGKDTIAQYLIEHNDFVRVGFADILKEAVANLFNIPLNRVNDMKEDTRVTLEIGNGEVVSFFTGREILQRFGTEMGRNTFGENFWVIQWEEYLFRNSLHTDNVVIPDVRFNNEASRIHQLEGIIIKVNRPGYEPDGHESEKPLPSIYVDYSITNDGTIEDLHTKVFTLMEEVVSA